MEQFSLEKWLQDKSRKVVTRDGRPVRIVCTDLKNNHPIIAAIKGDNNEIPYYYDINGKCLFYDSKDLFFADEEDELTEFEKEVDAIIDENIKRNIGIKYEARNLLDLARKEFEKSNVIVDKDKYIKNCDYYYEQGKQDVLKDLPKWKKSLNNPKLCEVVPYLGDYLLYWKGYYISMKDLEKLPKED